MFRFNVFLPFHIEINWTMLKQRFLSKKLKNGEILPKSFSPPPPGENSPPPRGESSPPPWGENQFHSNFHYKSAEENFLPSP